MIKVKNQAEEAEIYISGDIVDDEDGSWLEEWNGNTDGYEFPKEIKSQLDAVKGKPLTVYINSYGGSVSAGLAMAHMIERHDAPTTAIIDAYCCSIATQIFFSADKCKMPSNSYLMLHKPIAYSEGNADDFRKTAEVLDTIQAGLESVYQKKLKDKSTDVRSMMNEETWLTGTDAANLFNIELLDAEKTLNCAGSLNKLKSLHFQRIPRSLNFGGEFISLQSFLDEQREKQENMNKKMQIVLSRARGVCLA